MENETKNLANIHQSTWISQNWDFDGILLSKVEKYELKIHRRVMCHKNQEWCKIRREIDIWFRNWHDVFDEFDPSNRKCQKAEF